MSQRNYYDIARDACMLASLIEGIAVLQHEAQGAADCCHASQARNALPPLIDLVIERAWALNEQLDRAAMMAGKAVSA